jgi:hypothetical protein
VDLRVGMGAGRESESESEYACKREIDSGGAALFRYCSVGGGGGKVLRPIAASGNIDTRKDRKGVFVSERMAIFHFHSALGYLKDRSGRTIRDHSVYEVLPPAVSTQQLNSLRQQYLDVNRENENESENESEELSTSSDDEDAS